MAQDPRLADLLARRGDPATVAWVHEGQGDLAALPDPELAIAAAAAAGNAAALQAVRGPKALKKAASRALHQLRSRGVKVAEAVRPATFTLGREAVAGLNRAFLSLPDSEGDLELLLVAGDEEGICVLGTILGGPTVLREARHAHVNRSGLREVIRSVEERRSHAELPFVAGLALADRVYTGRPEHAWQHFLDHVPAATLQSARVLGPTRGLPAPRADEPEPTPWMPSAGLLAPQPLQEAVTRMMEITVSPLYPDQESRRAAFHASTAAAADAALDEDARRRLGEYLDYVVLAARWYGWPRHAEPLERIAALVANGTPGSQIEAVRAAVELHVAQTAISALTSAAGEAGR